MTPPAGSGLIAGQVVDLGSGTSTGGIQVILIDQESNFEWRVNSDSKGRFFFDQLPARQFAIQTVATDSGGTRFSTSTGFGRLVTLNEGERVTDLRIGILRFGSASGVVQDDAGDPVVGMTVVAFRRTFAGGRIVYSASNRAHSDDRGEFTLYLTPGEYLICACERALMPTAARAFDALAPQPLSIGAAARRVAAIGEAALQFDDTLLVHAPAFHPASPTAAQAERVVIGSAEHKAGVNIGVVAVRAARVSGRIVGAPSPVAAASILLRPIDEPGGLIPDLAPPIMRPGDQFIFADVPPGEYTLTVIPRQRDGALPRGSLTDAVFDLRNSDSGERVQSPPRFLNLNPLWAQMKVSVGTSDISDLVIAVQPAATVSGRVELTGAASAQSLEQVTRIRIGIEPAYRTPGEPAPAPPAQVTADGSFSLPGISPGRYFLQPSGSAAPWSTLKSVTVAGRDVTDLPLDVGPDGLRDLVVTFDDAPMSRVPGRLVGIRSLTAADAVMVVVFPVDRTLWAMPPSRRFRATGVDQKGAFTLTGLPPGDYYVTPLEDRYGVIWQDEKNLAQLARSATTITILPGPNPTLEIRR